MSKTPFIDYATPAKERKLRVLGRISIIIAMSSLVLGLASFTGNLGFVGSGIGAIGCLPLLLCGGGFGLAGCIANKGRQPSDFVGIGLNIILLAIWYVLMQYAQWD